MSKTAPVEIAAAANGFIVQPGARDTNCTFAKSSMFVFNEFDDMVKWLGEHFEQPTEQAK